MQCSLHVWSVKRQGGVNHIDERANEGTLTTFTSTSLRYQRDDEDDTANKEDNAANQT